jgi:AraC-like DNA-binding protein
MAVWAVWCAKDLVTTFPGMYTRDVLDWILIIDGWSAITYTVLVLEVVSPGWTTWRRLALLSLPFALFTAVYALWPLREVVYAYSAFLWCYAWTVVIVGYRRMSRYLRFVRNEYSNIDQIDVAWLKPVFVFSIVGQLAWLFISHYATLLTDIVYYVCIIALWLLVLYYSWDFRPIVVVDACNTVPQKDTLPIARGSLEQLMDEQHLYLNPNLTLQDLAGALNTNRTYVSNYISQVMGLNFYDYINQLRIERVSLPMMKSHPEYKLEHVARESGFASISTFRRAFIKQTGQTPSQYELQLTLSANT